MDIRAFRLSEQALTLPEDQRAAFIAVQAAADVDLRAAALALLAAHAASAGLLETRLPPAQIGSWRLCERIGVGGMGEVFRVERDLPEGVQLGALKRIPAGRLAPQLLARFAAERRFLSQLSHPHIARILDAGNDAEGQPWVVMEYVDGVPIDQWCQEQRLDVSARVRVFLQVLDAVDAAHRAMVLHRDLKPANIVVDRAGHVRLLDFGIARSLVSDSGLTETGMNPQTPQFASPEQRAGDVLTTASDVYALGLILFLLLTRQLPDLSEQSMHGRHTGRNTDPIRPSGWLSPARLGLDERATKLWRKQLSGDLDRVVMKALAPDLGRRYARVTDLAADLQNWLERRPVSARLGDRRYRFKMFLRRHRLWVAAGLSAALALSLGLAIALLQARHARQEAARATSTSRFLMALLGDANPIVSGQDLSLKQAVDQAVERIPEHFLEQPDTEAEVRIGLANAYTNVMELDAAEKQLERALALLDRSSKLAGDALRAQALLDWTRGRTDRAEARYVEALGRYREHADDAGTGQVLNDLAALMNDLGRGAEAVDYAQQAVANARELKLRAQALGSRLENLAGALHGINDLEAAAKTYQQAVAALEQGMPRSSLALATALNNFALVRRDQAQAGAALILFERAIAVREGSLGRDDPNLAGPLTNAARLRADLGDLAGAQRDMQRALVLAEKAFAPDYVARGHVHMAAAHVALAQGDARRAREHAKAAIDVFARADHANPSWIERAREYLRRAEVMP